MSYVLLSESFPIARKPYRCIWCGEGIPVGEKHRHERSKFDGFQDHRWHLECDAEAQEVFNDGDCEFSPYAAPRPKKEIANVR